MSSGLSFEGVLNWEMTGVLNSAEVRLGICAASAMGLYPICGIPKIFAALRHKLLTSLVVRRSLRHEMTHPNTLRLEVLFIRGVRLGQRGQAL
jgi:hypothetical protein